MAHHHMSDDLRARGLKPNIWTFQAAWGTCTECHSTTIEIAAPESGGTKPCNTFECQMDEVTVRLERFDWFYAFCLPGDMPEMDPIGPFDTEELALLHARED